MRVPHTASEKKKEIRNTKSSIGEEFITDLSTVKQEQAKTSKIKNKGKSELSIILHYRFLDCYKENWCV